MNSEINSNTILQMTYNFLRDMLIEFQMDGYRSDGCSDSLFLNEDEEILQAIKDNDIQIMKGAE